MERILLDLARSSGRLGQLCAPYRGIEDQEVAARHRLWALLLITLGTFATVMVAVFYAADPRVGVRGPTVPVVSLLVILGYAINRSRAYRSSPHLVIALTLASIWWNAWYEPRLSHAVAYYTLSLLGIQLTSFMLPRGTTLFWLGASLVFGVVLRTRHPALTVGLLLIPSFLLVFVTFLTLIALDARRRDKEALKAAHASVEERTAELTKETASLVRTESALRNSQELFRAITHQSCEGIAVSDLEGNYTFVNLAFCEMVGYSQAELLLMTVFDVKSKDQDRSSFAKSKESMEGLPLQVSLQRKDGTTFSSEVTGRVIAVGDQRVVLGTVRDITARLRHEEEKLLLERQLLHAQKLESLGVLAGGIAHDFNNLLMAVLGNADLALDSLPPVSPARANLREIESATKRAAELARQMLAYSGRGSFVIEPIDLSALVEETAQLLEVAISKKVAFQTKLAPDLPRFSGDATQIRQVIMNLVTNASEAIGEESGVVSLTTGVEERGRAGPESADPLEGRRGHDSLGKGTYVFLEVTDDGCGMDAETQARIFDPFFTTKFAGRGLGLSAVQGIVRGHEGTILSQSELGKGTTVRIRFPLGAGADPEPEEPAPGGAAEVALQGTVLVADDEAAVCDVAQKMLESMGFDVLTAQDGREALEVFRTQPDEIVLVLLDLTMPHLDGAQVFAELSRVRPELPVVLCSGYCEVDASDKFANTSLTGFLQKPFGMKTLAEAVRKALSSTSGPN